MNTLLVIPLGVVLGILCYYGYKSFVRRLWGKAVICAYSAKWKITEAYDPAEDYAHFIVWRKILFCWIPVYRPDSIYDAEEWGKRFRMNSRGLGPGWCQDCTEEEIKEYTKQYGTEFT